MVVLLTDPLLRAIVVRRLELLGYHAAVAADAGTLTVAVLDAAADAALIDLDLPDAAALRAVERLRADESTKHLRVLGFAGDGPLDIVEDAFTAGVNDFLVVPFDPLVLEQKVAAAVAPPAKPAKPAKPAAPAGRAPLAKAA